MTKKNPLLEKVDELKRLSNEDLLSKLIRVASRQESMEYLAREAFLASAYQVLIDRLTVAKKVVPCWECQGSGQGPLVRGFVGWVRAVCARCNAKGSVEV